MKIPSVHDIITAPIKNFFQIPQDSESTAAVVDRVDIGKFQPRKTFTASNAATLASLATMAYSTPADQKKHLAKQPAVKSFHFLDSKDNQKLGIDAPDTGTQVSLVETRNSLLVAARGTSPPWLTNLGSENDAQWQDYVVDLAAAPTTNYDGSALVHGGFKEAADGIWGQLKPYLEAARASHKTIHMCGHSLGAAIALQLGDRMTEEMGLLPRSVVRTGGPDIGWGGEKKHLEHNGLAARTVNFVNNADPVPLVLPGGQSAGTNIYFDRHGVAQLKGGPHITDRVLGTVEGLLRATPEPVYSHVPVFYNNLIDDRGNQEILKGLEA